MTQKCRNDLRRRTAFVCRQAEEDTETIVRNWSMRVLERLAAASASTARLIAGKPIITAEDSFTK